ncbi:type VI secretion system-associated protein TagF [Desulfosarcina cetonica]|uniref:type VI secretion system-associated protein TagF n=1 Tax=Desulfosarcina cetonica TaxID=90730 RepID=UPI0009F8E8CF|nr:type VI secretion system-associated protein TagF [Desulfosarcina cetonica]
MLGRLIGRQRWSWAAFGKHPATKDYFQIQVATPLAHAFSRWVEAGFGRMDENDRRHRVCSWRFWSRGLKKGSMVGGLGRSSADGIGRPYPLVLLGEGTSGAGRKSGTFCPFCWHPCGIGWNMRPPGEPWRSINWPMTWAG